MNTKTKILVLILLLFFVILTIVNCATKKPILPEKIFYRYDIDYDIYERMVVLEFTPNPQVKKGKNISDIFEDETRKNGYLVISINEFNSVLEDFGFSKENLTDPEVLKIVSEKLNISAVIKGIVNHYQVEKKKGTRVFIAAELPLIMVDTKYYCDISLNIDMIEVQEGNKIWSSSISCNKKKGNPEKVLRKMIRNCLKTIPTKL